MSRLTAASTRAARWSATHPWRAIGAWLGVIAIAVGLAFAVPTRSTTQDDYRIGESGRAHAMLADAGLLAAPSENFLIAAREGAANPHALDNAATQLRARMQSAPGITEVSPVIWNDDRSAALVSVSLDPDIQDVTPLADVAAHVQRSDPSVTIHQAGDVSIDAGINERVAADLHTAEAFSLPVTLLLMLLAFGALIAAGVPVLIAGGSVAATMGIAAPISHLVPAEPTVSSMIVLIGMAVGVDYALFYLKREREERAKGAGTIDAVAIAARTSGHAILVSGAAVMASLTGLLLAGGATFTSLATGAILVVAMAMISSITVLPALLVTLGRWVDRPRIPLLWRVNRRIGPGGISRRLISPVLRHPRIALALGLAVIIGLSLPAVGMRLHQATLHTLPQDIPAVATANRIAAQFPSQGTRATVVVQAIAAEQHRIEAALRALSATATATADFGSLGTHAIKVSTDSTTTLLDLAIRYPAEDPRADAAVQALRKTLAPNALGGLDAAYAVGGDAAWSLDAMQRQADRLPWVIAFVIALTVAMMWLAFRSWRLAVLSSGLNLLSVGVAFGVMRLIFQDGHGESLLDFHSPGYVIEWVPLLVLTILVGLSMDYHVFVLSRIREYADRGLPMRVAVRLGITDTAGVVTSAAAVMVSVFAIFAAMSLIEMKMMGVGLAVAILLDATVIRLVLLPAALVLLGERAWPRRAAAPAPAVQARRLVAASAAP